MSYRMEERTKGYTGYLINGFELAKIAQQILALQYDNPSTVKIDDLLLIKLAKQDAWGEPTYALVCDEGVGWEQDEYRTIEVPTNVGGGWHNGRVHISIDVILSCVSTRQKDIAEYVRVFGDRLDNNVSIWQAAMFKSKQLVNND
jgi:hypothetical protein